MREQHLFEFLGVDVLSAADDHVLEAALDGAVAPFVHRGEVARAQPAVFVDRLSGLFGHVVVAHHDVIAPHAQLADLTDRYRVAGVRGR